MLTTEADVAQASEPGTRRRRVEPMHALMALAAMLAVLALMDPLDDIDVYWHVLIGREILDTGRVGGLGTAWSLNLTGTDWTTTQWLSEVVISWVQDWFGWRGLMVLRDLLGVLMIAMIARQLLRRGVPRVVAPVFAVTAIAVALASQDRPMVATLLFSVWLGGIVVDLLLDGRRPNLWLTAGLVVLWANLHGGWVIAPLAFGVVAVGMVLDGRASRSTARSAALACAVTAIAGCLTPIGIDGLLAPLRFAGATSRISEWQPTSAVTGYGLVLGLLAGALVWTWARGALRPTRAEVVYVGVMFVFAMQAYRNVAVAALLLSPLVVERISRSYRTTRTSCEPPVSTLLWILIVIAPLAGIGVLTYSTATIDPLEQAKPVAIARTLADTPGQKRVLNAYNTSGVLAAFGGPRTRLAIDGRADRFGGAFIQHYTDAIQLEGDWQAVVREVDPNYAVLPSDSALAGEFRREGWTLMQTDGDYVLLADRR